MSYLLFIWATVFARPWLAHIQLLFLSAKSRILPSVYFLYRIPQPAQIEKKKCNLFFLQAQNRTANLEELIFPLNNKLILSDLFSQDTSLYLCIAPCWTLPGFMEHHWTHRPNGVAEVRKKPVTSVLRAPSIDLLLNFCSHACISFSLMMKTARKKKKELAPTLPPLPIQHKFISHRVS